MSREDKIFVPKQKINACRENLETGASVEQTAEANDLSVEIIRTLIAKGQLPKPKEEPEKSAEHKIADEFIALCQKHRGSAEIKDCIEIFNKFFKAKRGLEESVSKDKETLLMSIHLYYRNFLKETIHRYGLKTNKREFFFGVHAYEKFSVDDINTAYKNFGKLFHPDKLQQLGFDLEPGELRMNRELFAEITQIKDELLSHQRCLRNFLDLVEKGDEHVYYAEEDKFSSAGHLEQAYRYYLSACQTSEADEAKKRFLIDHRVRLRIKMAHVVLKKQDFLRAELFKIAASKLLTDYYDQIKPPALRAGIVDELFKLSAEIIQNIKRHNQGISEQKVVISPRLDEKKSSSPLSLSSSNSLIAIHTSQALMATSQSAVFDSVEIKKALQKDIQALSMPLIQQTMLNQKMSRDIVSNSLSEISQFEVQNTAGTLFLQSLKWFNRIGISNCIFSLLREANPYGKGLLLALSVGHLWNIQLTAPDLSRHSQNSKITKNLKNALEKAHNEYIKGHFSETLKWLLSDLTEVKNEMQILSVDSQGTLGTIDFLRAYQVPTHAIVFILLMAAECYMSRTVTKIDLGTPTPSDMNHKARRILRAIIENEDTFLRDTQAYDQKLSAEEKSNFRKLWNNPLFMFNGSKKPGFQENIFSEYLQELLITARIALAIESIIAGDEDTARQTLRELERTLQKRSLDPFNDLDPRLELTRNFMAIMGYGSFFPQLDQNIIVHQIAPIPEEDYKSSRAQLSRIRKIHLIKSPQDVFSYTDIIPIAPDGDCFFTAIRESLYRTGEYARVFPEGKEISRLHFIEYVYKKSAENLEDDIVWNRLLHSIYEEDKAENFDQWRERFLKPSHRVKQCHLNFISRLFNIQFQLYRVADSTPPYVQVSSKVWERPEMKGEIKPAAVLHLLHTPLLSEQPDSIHFEPLILSGKDKALSKIEELLHQCQKKIQDLSPDKELKRASLEKEHINLVLRKSDSLYHLAILAEKQNQDFLALEYWEKLLDCYKQIRKHDPTYWDEKMIQSVMRSGGNDHYQWATDIADQALTRVSQKETKARLYYYQAMALAKLRNFQSAKSKLLSAKINGLDEKTALSSKMYIERIEIKHRQNYSPDKNFVSLMNERKKLPPSYKVEVKLPMDASGVVKEKEKYKILSIDGGGIRGIIPCIWLAEITKQTGAQPLAHIFNLMSGTSTGAIIAAGLSAKKSEGQYYSPEDILQLYTEKAEKIFQKSVLTGIRGWLTEKYSAIGLENELKSYFEKQRIFDCRSELLIPSVAMRNLETRWFSTVEAKLDQRKNYLLTDILRASSAAPTFFREHSIGEDKFVDGGVKVNNPALKACGYAHSHYDLDPKEIFILSLGTGAYIPSAIEPSSHRGLLFWASNIFPMVSEKQEYETHLSVQTVFHKAPRQYYRFQSRLYEPIPLDATKPEVLHTLIDIADEAIETGYASDDNELNQVIEALYQRPAL